MRWKTQLVRLVASGLGTGYAPKAPGTVASVALCLVWYLLCPDSLLMQLGLAILFLCLGLYVCHQILAETNNTSQDPGWIVIDEWAGLSLAFLAVPSPCTQPLLLLFALLLFRFFDIVKPPPVSTAESLGGHWGIMLDDLVAGTLALLVLFIGSTIPFFTRLVDLSIR